MARDNRVRIDPIVIETGEDDLTGHAGLVAFDEWLRRKRVPELLDARLPQAATDNGYPSSAMVLAQWLNILVNGRDATPDDF